MASEASPRPLPLSIVAVFAGILVYPAAGCAVYFVLYGSRAPEWLAPLAWEIAFSLAFALHNLASVSVSRLVARRLKEPVALTVAVLLVVLVVLSLPTLWVLGYHNNCLQLPGPGPFGGSGLGCT